MAAALKGTHGAWNHLTVGRDGGDGIVAYGSQVYPGAIRNYRAPEPVSHTAEIDSRTSALAISTILREELEVPLTPR